MVQILLTVLSHIMKKKLFLHTPSSQEAKNEESYQQPYSPSVLEMRMENESFNTQQESFIWPMYRMREVLIHVYCVFFL